MIFKAKKLIVISLEKMCDITRHHFCNKFAYAACVLDEKWGTSVWKTELENNEYSQYEED